MKKESRIRIILTALFICVVQLAYSYNMRQTSNRDGLSNSAILSMAQDDSGYLWIGTCDGVNIADGRSVSSFGQIFPGQSLSGNIIESLRNGGNGRMWVLTNYGLDLVNIRSGQVTTFKQFGGQEQLAFGADGVMYLLGEDLGLYRISADKDKNGFEKLGRIAIPFRDVRRMTVRGDKLWILTNGGIRMVTIPSGGGSDADISVKIVDNDPILFAKVFGDEIFVVTRDGWICRVLRNGKRQPLANISEEVRRRGRISDIARNHQGQFFVSFSTDGVIQVSASKASDPVIVDMDIKVGVFCLEASSKQDVVWIGSDCQGLYTCWEDSYGIRSFDFNALGNKITHPIRSILVDARKTLWLGTKGDGLLRIKNFDESRPESSLGGGSLYTSTNSQLLHNSVYGFGRSSRPILWIGTEDGLNYYSYDTDRIYRVNSPKDIRNIHNASSG